MKRQYEIASSNNGIFKDGLRVPLEDIVQFLNGQEFVEDIGILNEVCSRMRKREREVNEWDYSYRMGSVLTNCSNLISNAISQCIIMDDLMVIRLKQKAAAQDKGSVQNSTGEYTPTNKAMDAIKTAP